MLRRFAAFCTAALFAIALVLQRRYLKRYRALVGDIHTTDDACVSSTLLQDVRRIGRIALPSITSKEGIYNTLFVALFAVKAACRAWASMADGGVLRAMVAPRFVAKSFKWALIEKGTAVVLGAVVSGVIEHLRHWLITAYRVRLTKHFHDRFYAKLIYYQGTSIDGRLRSADTAIVEFCGEFAEHYAELPYYFVLPLMEASLSMAALIRQTGARTALPLTAVVALSMAAVRQFAPPFGKIHAAVLERQELLKKGHVAAINKVELIALHNAGAFTKGRLDVQLAKLDDALSEMALAKGHFEMIENTISWLWNVAAYLIALSTIPSATEGKRKVVAVSQVVVQLRLMNDFNSSVKDFIVNFREMSHLSEFTTKLVEFDDTLDAIAKGEYCLVVDAGDSPTLKESPLSQTHVTGTVLRSPRVVADDASFSLVQLNNVNVMNPKGNILVEGLTIDIRNTQNWAIVGPNGSGKSSILRLLAGLWPPTSGTATVESSVAFYFLPQEEYLLAQSTLLEQLAFPDKVSIDQATGIARDSELTAAQKALEQATAAVVVEVVGGKDSAVFGADCNVADRTFDWSSLSGGQRQKLALARVFFHAATRNAGRTQICVLDESTSAMDYESEKAVFENLRHSNLNFISVTHREEVLCHHTHVLQLSTDPAGWHAFRRSSHF